MSKASLANYGPGSGGGTYRGGSSGTLQNQPLQSDLGPAYGAWRSQNVYNEGQPWSTPETVLQQWAQLQQQYPQYTNHAKVNTLTDDQIHAAQGNKYNALAYGGNGQITLNADYLKNESPAAVRGLLLKELGQVMSQRMLGTPAAADQLMQLWGYDKPAANEDRYPSGLPGANWNGDTSRLGPGKNAMPGQINVGGYTSFPEDTYGIAFARALGSNAGRSTDNTAILSGPALQYAQMNGMLPRAYSPPTTPQMPQRNVSDFGRGVNNVRMPVQAPAVLPAQVNNPRINAYARVGGVRYS